MRRLILRSISIMPFLTELQRPFHHLQHPNRFHGTGFCAATTTAASITITSLRALTFRRVSLNANLNASRYFSFSFEPAYFQLLSLVPPERDSLRKKLDVMCSIQALTGEISKITSQGNSELAYYLIFYYCCMWLIYCRVLACKLWKNYDIQYMELWETSVSFVLNNGKKIKMSFCFYNLKLFKTNKSQFSKCVEQQF